MGGRMYLGNDLVTPVIVDVSLEFSDLKGDPMDNAALAEDLNAKQDVIEDLETIRSGASAGATALQPNTAITGATKCKITYDSKGLVTSGADLQANDIPDISATYQVKLVSGTNIKTVNGTSLLGSGNITIDSLPPQAGNNGKFLSTDGTDASWTEIVGFTASEVQTIWESINV